MKKSTKIILGIGVVVVLFLILRKYFNNGKSSVDEATINSNSAANKPSNGTSGGTKVSMDNDTTLKVGVKGDRVQWLQYYFNKYVAAKKGYTPLKEDGVFGSKTETAVKGTIGKNSTTWTEWKSFIDTHFNKK